MVVVRLGGASWVGFGLFFGRWLVDFWVVGCFLHCSWSQVSGFFTDLLIYVDFLAFSLQPPRRWSCGWLRRLSCHNLIVMGGYGSWVCSIPKFKFLVMVFCFGEGHQLKHRVRRCVVPQILVAITKVHVPGFVDSVWGRDVAFKWMVLP
ncbi:hypothetical protein MtrunA17_Chr4g0035821 [Medicago truncatula]|uniref:Uncharacterized protein n=1 Tax=Medicago truncatula TaxID=3880 RepID=A0A396I6Y8_MEDTR|nr:hypothetical protein MtrunA17_Chr4g0035821 [Medicago truncatula]